MGQALHLSRERDSGELGELVSRSARIGIDLCRRGLWKQGLVELKVADANKDDGRTIPGLALTYLGYGIASQEKRVQDGIRYCREGVDREIWRAENHLNLARTYLLTGRVRAAIASLDYGLGLEPTNQALLDLRLKLGVRRRPMIFFLDRSHPLNRLAGRLRHQLAGFEMPVLLAPKSHPDGM
jgi:hypothetical protein